MKGDTLTGMSQDNHSRCDRDLHRLQHYEHNVCKINNENVLIDHITTCLSH